MGLVGVPVSPLLVGPGVPVVGVVGTGVAPDEGAGTPVVAPLVGLGEPPITGEGAGVVPGGVVGALVDSSLCGLSVGRWLGRSPDA